MKKLNLTFKVTLLFIAFLTCSFIAKNDINLTTEKTTTSKETTVQYTNKVLIMHPAGSTASDKLQTRNCIASNVGAISMVTQCPNNPNVEIITFTWVQIPIGTSGLSGGDDDDDDELANGYFNTENGPQIISASELNNRIGRCSNIIAYGIGVSDCSGPLPIDPTNIGM
ncbi:MULTISPECIES: hypothetical protein [unclassified Tenacibaculum]|uniref:hypothetical protein n=1 Tax=unclassified Tenacibaculum TaxID=2635139 RepID=UPI001F407224|nr:MULTISPECIES: hypothetical protein [unclassified Tenacibaculum]MCF2876331.1 hypothetical protein [Tenacibaculum sp. Cn5-1]MCF2936406.1 hypothetical protein [Tenacibaculum sp. Cn5-34]MCG7511749.1 hypothetical protein [Tenacibaculum sp. Cn5-46]